MNRRHFSLLCASAGLMGLSALPALAEQPRLKMDAEKAYKLAATGTGFATGPMMAANTVYVFFDTTCPHCAHLWKNLLPLQSKVKVVWLPTGFLRPISAKQGTTILMAPNPAAAMNENEDKLMAHQGGITVAPTLNDEVMAKVKANTVILGDKLGADSVPLVLFRNARTGAYAAHAGAAETAQLSAMFGL